MIDKERWEKEMISFRFRIKREKKKITQKEIAKQVGCSTSVISRFESKARQPTERTLKRIFEIVGITQKELDKIHEMAWR